MSPAGRALLGYSTLQEPGLVGQALTYSQLTEEMVLATLPTLIGSRGGGARSVLYVLGSTKHPAGAT